MAAEKDRSAKKSQRKGQGRKPKTGFDPTRPFAEGVRGDESFIIQGGREFRKEGLQIRGVLDG